MSQPRMPDFTAANMSPALRTSVRATPGGVGSDTGPATSVTSAPASHAARAIAKPIRPELALVMTRTGSIGSSVGPAVTSTRLPARTLGWKKASIAARIAAGSSMRPMPVSPQAWSPATGPAIAQGEHVALRRGVFPHLYVHRRRNEQRAAAREHQRGEQVIGQAVHG